VGTQALSGAGFLKMITKATDAVSKMTIKMNESDVVSSAVNGRSGCAALPKNEQQKCVNRRFIFRCEEI